VRERKTMVSINKLFIVMIKRYFAIINYFRKKIFLL